MGKSRNHMALSERYGEDQGRHYRSGQNYTDAPTPEDFEDRLTSAAKNDWDTREQQRAFNLALKDKEFRSGLDSETRDFVDNYNKGKDHHKGMAGINTISDVHTLNDFGKLWHKNESGNGGKYTSANDFANATSHMDDRMRKHYDRNFLTQDDLPKPEETTLEDTQPADKEISLSPEHQQAKDRLDDYKNSIISGGLTNSIYGKESNFTKPQNFADTSKDEVSAKNDTSDINVDAFASKAKQASSNFLSDYKKKLTNNFVPEIF